MQYAWPRPVPAGPGVYRGRGAAGRHSSPCSQGCRWRPGTGSTSPRGPAPPPAPLPAAPPPPPWGGAPPPASSSGPSRWVGGGAPCGQVEVQRVLGPERRVSRLEKEDALIQKAMRKRSRKVTAAPPWSISEPTNSC